MYSFHLMVMNNIFFLSRLSCFEFKFDAPVRRFQLIMIINLFVNVIFFFSYKTKLIKNAKLINFNTYYGRPKILLDSIIRN